MGCCHRLTVAEPENVDKSDGICYVPWWQYNYIFLLSIIAIIILLLITICIYRRKCKKRNKGYLQKVIESDESDECDTENEIEIEVENENLSENEPLNDL